MRGLAWSVRQPAAGRWVDGSGDARVREARAALDALARRLTKHERAYLQFQDAFIGAIPPVQTLGDKAQEGGNKTQHAGQQAAGAVAGYQALGNAPTMPPASFQNMYTQVGHAPGYEGSLRTANDMLPSMRGPACRCMAA